MAHAAEPGDNCQPGARERAHVHTVADVMFEVVEVDERLREALDDAVGARENVSVHWGDAMRLAFAQLRPRPDKVVANLPYGIAAGPDSALYFTEPGVNQTTNKIGRITTAGVITEYTIPTATSRPGEIAASADGSLCFS